MKKNKQLIMRYLLKRIIVIRQNSDYLVSCKQWLWLRLRYVLWFPRHLNDCKCLLLFYRYRSVVCILKLRQKDLKGML